MPDDCAIRLWLSGLPDGKRSLKRPRELDMATPPRSSFQTGRSLSPSKKRKMDEDGDEDDGGSISSRSDNDRTVGQDLDATPRWGPPSQRPALSMRPASFHPPSSTSSKG